MSPHIFVTASMALTFGVPMVIAAREFWTLGPSPRHLPPQPPAAPDPVPLPNAGARPATLVQKPLPACLIPQPATTRVREPA